jgi:hypothetical protein
MTIILSLATTIFVLKFPLVPLTLSQVFKSEGFISEKVRSCHKSDDSALLEKSCHGFL